MVVEGSEAVLRNLALVERNGLDFVFPSAHTAVDGEVLRGEVVVEEVPVVFGGFDIELHFLCVLVHIDLGFHLDGDAEGFVVDTHETRLPFAEEAEGIVVLPAEVVEEEGGAHLLGNLLELSVGAVGGIGGGTFVGTEEIHQREYQGKDDAEDVAGEVVLMGYGEKSESRFYTHASHAYISSQQFVLVVCLDGNSGRYDASLLLRADMAYSI